MSTNMKPWDTQQQVRWGLNVHDYENYTKNVGWMKMSKVTWQLSPFRIHQMRSHSYLYSRSLNYPCLVSFTCSLYKCTNKYAYQIMFWWGHYNYIGQKYKMICNRLFLQEKTHHDVRILYIFETLSEQFRIPPYKWCKRGHFTNQESS